MKLHLDIETYSSEELTTAGVYRYTEAIDFEILLFAFSYNDERTNIIDLANGEALPEIVVKDLLNPEVEKHAHNANFERQCLKVYGYDIPANQWHCSAIKASYCGLPRQLAQVSAALALGEDAKGAGTALINYFCKPCKPSRANGQRFRNFPHHDPEKWEEFKAYCKQDIVAERAVGQALSAYEIPTTERENYILDQKINDVGVRIDLPFAQKCVDVDTRFSNEIKGKMAELTGLENPNSPTQLKKWLSVELQKSGRRGPDEWIESIDKEAVAALIEEILKDNCLTEKGYEVIAASPEKIPDYDGLNVVKALKFRKLLGKTSVKKYTAMLNCACLDDRARGLLQFYGARTGRWAGRLVQLQNLPQNHIDDLALAKNVILTGNYTYIIQHFENDLPDTLSQLVRTGLIAKLGHTFIIADFNAIEARVIAWLAGEEWRMRVFRTHGKIYEASAALMFGVDINTVTKGSDLRAKGKVAELALGYQGAKGALAKMGGEKMGLSEEGMENIVKKWRRANPAIVALWKDLEAAAKRALKTGKPTSCKGLIFDYDGHVLTIELPSGRKLFYQSPGFTLNKWKQESIYYWGQDSVTKRWVKLDTYGGKITENVVQAIARDLLADPMRDLDRRGFEICMHVHDEIIVEVGKQQALEALRGMCDIMSRENPWAKGLPLAADGYITEFYKKD